MTPIFDNYPGHTYLHRQGWVYSVLFHAMMGACAVVLMSGLTLSVEPDSYQWNVALVESPVSHPTTDALPESKPELPSKPQSVKPRSIPREVAAKPVQQETSSRPDFTETTPVNQTASTVIAQAVPPQEVIQTMVPVVTQDRVVEEVPPPTKEEVSNETATPVAEPVPPQPLAQESPTQQPSAEQIVASEAPLKTAPAAKADYGWLMRALLGRIDELKNYPVMARMNRWEGKVVLRAVIKDDGQVLMVDVQESSGRSILDNDAMETLKKASPIKLDQPLGKPQVAILMPISYSLR